MTPENEFYLDGNVLVEIDRENTRFRFWPDSGCVQPDAEEWTLTEMNSEYWHTDVSPEDLEEIAASTTRLDQRIEQGRRIVSKSES